MMASLPQSRLQAFTPPLYNTGVDYFGPLLVKERRSTVKRYGCLFTCLEGGKPRNIYSDNGTNFVGAEQELKECLERMKQAKISDTITRRNTVVL